MVIALLLSGKALLPMSPPTQLKALAVRVR
jgi:hypothetical protein